MLHFNGIDPLVTLMSNFNWGPISRKNIVSSPIQEQDLHQCNSTGNICTVELQWLEHLLNHEN